MNQPDRPQGLQAIFERILTHLRAQGKRAMGAARVDGSPYCAYRTDDGLRCAAGCLIPPEDYRPEFEGQGVDGRLVHGYFESRGYSDDEIAFIAHCQRDLHDSVPVECFPEALEVRAGRTAARFDLAVPPK